MDIIVLIIVLIIMVLVFGYNIYKSATEEIGEIKAVHVFLNDKWIEVFPQPSNEIKGIHTFVAGKWIKIFPQPPKEQL